MRSIDPVTLASARSVCIVADRVHFRPLWELCTLLGGGWQDGLRIWKRSALPYVVLLAHTPKRIRIRAPIVVLGRDTVALNSAVAYACTRLDDIQCLWVRMLDEPANTTVAEIVLADARVEGAA